MRPKLFRNNTLQWAIIAFIATVVILSIFPPDFNLTRKGANYAVHTMFACLFMGLFFLTIRQRKLMFASFIGCSILCLFLKNASNNTLTHAQKTVEEVLDISQFNATAFNENANAACKSILEINSDVISIHEISPDWGKVLKKELKDAYPHQQIIYRMEDFLGIGIFSKNPISVVDTFYFNDVPNIAIEISNGLDDISLISSFVYPEFSANDNQKVKAHFDALKGYIKNIDSPVIAVGDYNQVQWSSHLQDLKKSCELNDSRRYQFFDNPTDHIFFSQHFNCVDFQTISNRFTSHLGVKGSYQINRNFVDAQKTLK